MIAYPPNARVTVTYGPPEHAPRSFDSHRVIHRRFESWIDPATGREAGRWTWQAGHPPHCHAR